MIAALSFIAVLGAAQADKPAPKPAPCGFDFYYKGSEFDNFKNGDNTPIGAISDGARSWQEIYNAPLYNCDDVKIGEVSFFDNLALRGTSLYVQESATYFFDAATGFGSAINYEFPFQSATGSSSFPVGAQIKVESSATAGSYFGKSVDITINVDASGKRFVNLKK